MQAPYIVIVVAEPLVKESEKRLQSRARELCLGCRDPVDRHEVARSQAGRGLERQHRVAKRICLHASVGKRSHFACILQRNARLRLGQHFRPGRARGQVLAILEEQAEYGRCRHRQAANIDLSVENHVL